MRARSARAPRWHSPAGSHAHVLVRPNPSLLRRGKARLEEDSRRRPAAMADGGRRWQVPIFFVLTKTDICPANVLQVARQQVPGTVL
jgi:hypothetical protein